MRDRMRAPFGGWEALWTGRRKSAPARAAPGFARLGAPVVPVVEESAAAQRGI